MSLLAQAAESVIAVSPSVPPSTSQPYTASEETGSIRASLQYALDHWKPGQTTLSAPAEAILDRSNTGSFGETHAQELQQIATASPSAPVQIPVPVPVQEPGSAASPPSPLQTQQGPVSSPLTADVTPTVGPSSGSLHDIHSYSQGSPPATYDITRTPAQEKDSSSDPAKRYESAEEEKRRLEREERERLSRSDSQSGGSATKQDDPSADDGEPLPPYQEL